MNDPKFVIDASAISAVIFQEPDAFVIEKQIKDSGLIAPTLIDYEVGAVLLKKLKLYPKSRDELLRSFEIFLSFSIAKTKVHINNVTYLAEKTGLTVYDASYLWLSLEHEIPLITLDFQLASAIH